MKELKACYKVSSPLVAGGHEALKKGDCVRPPAIKGALRFWWRTINWSPIRKLHDNDNDALKALHNEESYLFGSAAGQTGQQAKVLLRVAGKLDSEVFQAKEKLPPGLAYLLGQGMHCRNEGTTRPGLSGNVTVRCVWREETLTEQQSVSIQQALLALGLLGSIGARARKGFGSLSIQDLALDGNELPCPQTPEQLKQWLQALNENCDNDLLPPFTAWSNKTRCWSLPLHSNVPKTLLNEYGKQMMVYRLSDQSKIGGSNGLGLFKSDAQNLSNCVEGIPIKSAPRRAVFGLPHNVFFIHNKQKVEVNPEDHERRASPLLAHLHEFPDGKLQMITTLLPAVFLPKGEEIKIKHKKSFFISFSPEWKVIEDFIQHCDGKELTA
ncbi:type III-B CRISPR module RAMP protein Cmr1 [uncultured Shewanella sp.]|uniref:type III-B CRISPR module RAMP protein Cmr1 n=1 Tax=uncultured Shewanella sp. TaxID=173975 RepID=UPI00260B301E|nr:type III-B CRISPR module RAMP protein Cmr1 [uncultured Shewanella sp.]